MFGTEEIVVSTCGQSFWIGFLIGSIVAAGTAIYYMNGKVNYWRREARAERFHREQLRRHLRDRREQ